MPTTSKREMVIAGSVGLGIETLFVALIMLYVPDPPLDAVEVFFLVTQMPSVLLIYPIAKTASPFLVYSIVLIGQSVFFGWIIITLRK